MKKIIAKAGLCALAATLLFSGSVTHQAQAAQEISKTSVASVNWRKKDKNEQKNSDKEASPTETPGDTPKEVPGGAPNKAPSRGSESSFIRK